MSIFAIIDHAKTWVADEWLGTVEPIAAKFDGMWEAAKASPEFGKLLIDGEAAVKESLQAEGVNVEGAASVIDTVAKMLDAFAEAHKTINTTVAPGAMPVPAQTP